MDRKYRTPTGWRLLDSHELAGLRKQSHPEAKMGVGGASLGRCIRLSRPVVDPASGNLEVELGSPFSGLGFTPGNSRIVDLDNF